jgi:phosphoserine phosphatase RsbU/P
LMYFAFLRIPLSRWIQVLLVIVALGYVFALAGISLGTLSVIGVYFSLLPLILLIAGVVPVLLVIHFRRGNREAGILLIPVILSSLDLYVEVLLALLGQVRFFAPAADRLSDKLQHLHAGPFTLGLGTFSELLYVLSLAIIIVLRTARIGRQQALLEGEVAAAREVQQVILPEQAEAVPGFRVESVYLPAQQVGGDFFQVLPAGEGGLLVVMGDVAGKGLPAAMLVSVLVGAIRTAAAYSRAPEELLAQLNERLLGRTHGGFSTALAAHITANGSVAVANAGHLPPYLDGCEVRLPGELPLGIAGGASYETTRFSLPPGGRLTFYSDGVVEAQNQKGELFGFDRGREISTQPATAIVEAARQFGQQDDITVVTIERLAAGQEPTAIGVSQVLVSA